MDKLTLQQTIKEVTKKHHTLLENLMFVNEIMNGTLTLHQYKQLILTNYLVHLRFEDNLFSSLSPVTANRLNISARKKLPSLVADIVEQHISIKPDEIYNTDLSFEDEAATLGALYVLEGATLGGNVIQAKLKNNTVLRNLNTAFNYYKAYGDSPFKYWKEFCDVLNAQPLVTHSNITEGAKKMFHFIEYVHIAVLQKYQNINF